MKKLSIQFFPSAYQRRISTFQAASLASSVLSRWLGVVFLVCLALTVQAQVPNLIWQKALGGSSDDRAYAITTSTDGGYVVAGQTKSNNGDVSGNQGNGDYWMMKLDGLGNLIWQKTLGGSGIDEATSITASPDGGYVVAGYTYSNNGDVSGNHGGYDSWVVKLDESGSIIWKRTLGGISDDYAHAITPSTDGGYVVAGSTRSNDGDLSGNHGSLDFWVVKLNGSGNLVWQKTLGGSYQDRASAITASGDGGYVVAGYTRSNDGDVTGNHSSGFTDYWVVKLNASGNLVWQKTLGGSDEDGASAITASADGGFVVAGYTYSNDGDVTGNHSGGVTDYWVVKLNGLGNLVWQKTLGGFGNDEATSITASADGGYVVAGSTRSNDGDVSGNHGGLDFWVVKLNMSGSLVWQKALGGLTFEVAYALTASGDGGYVVTGAAESNNGDVTGNHGANDYWVVKLGNQSLSVSSLSAGPSPVCAGQSVTFTATIANTTGTYSYTLTNNAGTTKTGSASGSAFSQSVIAAGSGSQNFTLTVTDSQSGSGTGSVNLTVNGSGSSLSAQSGDWNTASTWACGTVPTASSAVQIQAGHVVTIGAVVQAHSLSLGGGEVSFLNGGKLGLEN